MLLAACELCIEDYGMIINNCLLFQKNGRRWINLPQKEAESTKEPGKKVYFPYITFVDEVKKNAFNAAALEAIDDYVRNYGTRNDDGPVPF